MIQPVMVDLMHQREHAAQLPGLLEKFAGRTRRCQRRWLPLQFAMPLLKELVRVVHVTLQPGPVLLCIQDQHHALLIARRMESRHEGMVVGVHRQHGKTPALRAV